jgi:hypothetical protein
LGGLNNLFSLLLSPAWVQTFVMTFLGEWGDRSQIATVAMAAGSDYWWVTAGAVIGHGLCTAGAVIGGRAIAGKISMRNGKSASVAYYDSMLTFVSHSWWCHCLPSIWSHLSFRGLLPPVKVFTLQHCTAPWVRKSFAIGDRNTAYQQPCCTYGLPPVLLIILTAYYEYD